MISSLLLCAWTCHSTNSRRASFTSSRFRSIHRYSLNLFQKNKLAMQCLAHGADAHVRFVWQLQPKFMADLSECVLNMLFHYGDTHCSPFFVYLCVTSATSTTTYRTIPLMPPYNAVPRATPRHSCHLQIVLLFVTGVNDQLFGL